MYFSWDILAKSGWSSQGERHTTLTSGRCRSWSRPPPPSWRATHFLNSDPEWPEPDFLSPQFSDSQPHSHRDCRIPTLPTSEPRKRRKQRVLLSHNLKLNWAFKTTLCKSNASFSFGFNEVCSNKWPFPPVPWQSKISRTLCLHMIELPKLPKTLASRARAKFKWWLVLQNIGDKNTKLVRNIVHGLIIKTLEILVVKTFSALGQISRKAV